ncbi:MAG: aldo/keto reductase [Bacteroidales bacterium]|nr:aldo/keto reductase [Bacteroidales bacterium]
MVKTKLTRRQFVSTITAGAGTVIIGNAALASSSSGTAISSPAMKIITLGKSGLKTTLLGMGTGFSGYNRSSNITRAGVAESVIRNAYEKGVRFFDCADSYGTHTYTASALKGFSRESYTLGTKIWVSQGGVPEPERPGADVLVERFRKELNTDYLDLVQIHCMTDSGWTDKEKKQMDILENLKAKKVIRAHGVSVHSLEAMQACIGNPWVDVVHVRINSFGEAMDKSDPSLVTPVIEKLHKEGKGIIGMKLIGAGKFKNDPEKIDESLKYVLDLGTVDLIIVGFEKPEQIDDYIARVQKNVKL